MGFLWLLLPTFALSLVQLNNQVFSTYFQAASGPVVTLLTGANAFLTQTSSSYSVFTWVKFEVMPTSSQIFFSMKVNSMPLLRIRKETDGSFRADARTAAGRIVTASVTIPNPLSRQWAHIAVIMCSAASPATLTISATPWQGTLVSTAVQSNDPFVVAALESLVVYLGGEATGSSMTVRSTQGEMLDAQLDTAVCRATSESQDIVNSMTCHQECINGCSGPGDKSCLEFLQLADEGYMRAITPLEFDLQNPRLQGRDMVSNSYSYSGWYSETGNPNVVRDLFRTQNAAGDTERQFFVSSNRNAFLTQVVTSTLNLQEQQVLSIPVEPTQNTFISSWYNVQMSACGTTMTLCFALYADARMNCQTYNMAGQVGYLNNVSTARLIVADQYNMPRGRLGDIRYYPKVCKTAADFQSAFALRKTLKMPGAGYFLQPSNVNQCYTACPSGYTATGATCSGSDSVIADFLLNALGTTISGGASLAAVNGATSAGAEASDAVPAKNRGYIFNGAQYLRLPPAAGAIGSPLILNTVLTVSVWLQPSGATVRTIYSKAEGDNEIFTLALDTSNRVTWLGGRPRTNYTDPTTLTTGVWTFLAVTFTFSSTNGQTTVDFYFDGVKSATSYTAEFILRDESTTAPQVIGATAALSNFFTGSIWRVTIRNFVYTSFTSEIASAGCPAGVGFCLSTAPISQTPEGRACLGTCTAGCVRTTDCNLCDDLLCDSCSSFDAGTCTACVPNAAGSTCSCTPAYYASGRSCLACPSLCSACTSPTTCTSCVSNASLASDTCSCDDGFYSGNNGCEACDASCLTCSGGSTADCIISRPTATVECGDGFYVQNDSCEACNESCLTCSGGTATDCIISRPTPTPAVTVECGDGFYLQNDSCEVCNESCITCLGGAATDCIISRPTPTPAVTVECGDGFYLDSNSCQACNELCITCSGGAATDCITSRPIPTPTIECGDGFYLSNNDCEACDEACLTCSGGTAADCLTPRPQPASAVQCGDGFYLSNNDCEACDEACLTCSGGTAADCLTPRTQPASTVQCSDGFYLSNNDCEACDESCLTCSGGTAADCLTTRPARAYYCEEGFFLIGGECQRCDPLCLGCRASATICISCRDNARLRLTECECVSGAFPSPDAANCVLCSALCATCSDASSSSCITCPANSVLTAAAPSSCECRQGYFPSPDVSNCRACSPTCASCTDPGPSSCLSCYANALLNGDSPASCVCAPGHFPQPDARFCLACGPLCALRDITLRLRTLSIAED